MYSDYGASVCGSIAAHRPKLTGREWGRSVCHRLVTGRWPTEQIELLLQTLEARGGKNQPAARCIPLFHGGRLGMLVVSSRLG